MAGTDEHTPPNPSSDELRGFDSGFLRAVLEQLPSGVIVGDAPSGRLIFHNREASRMLGHPFIEADDTAGYAAYHGYHPDGTPYRAEEYPARRALQGETVYQEEIRYHTGDGTTRVFSVNASPVRGDDGSIEGVVVSFADITALKRVESELQESEERFRAMADNLPLIVWMHDAEGQQEFVNQTFCEFFGVSREDMKENRWRMLMHPDDAEAYTAEFLAAVTERRPFEAQVRVKRADGEWRWIHSWGKPRFGYDREYLGHVGTSADITEQKHSEDALRQVRADLEARVTERTRVLNHQTRRLRELSGQLVAAEHRERKRLASMLHDELQQYLVAGKFKLAEAESRVTDDELRSVVSDAMELIQEALAASRDLTHELRPPVLYEDGLVPALRWLSSEMGRRHEVSVSIDAPDVEEKLPVDDDTRALLFASVQELVFNAVKHAKTDAIEVSVRRRDRGLSIAVADEGAGFDAEQVHDTESTMGLFSVGERLRLLGGSMTIDSSPGSGTRITLELPLPQEAAPRASGLTRPDAAAPSEPGRSGARERDIAATGAVGVGGVRVLLVDDHAIARMGLASLLAEEPDVTVVGQGEDGVAAVELVGQLLPDVVVLDLNMPRMNGIDAAREIRRRWPEVRIVGVSVQDDQATIDAIINAGATAFVSKSADPARIRDAILGAAAEE